MDAQLWQARARLPAFRRKVEQATEIIGDALARMQSPYVAYSGGKDSTVVLHLVRAQKPDVPAHFGHEEWLLPETEALIAETDNVVKSALPDSHAEWFAVWQDASAVPDDVQYIDPAQYNEFDYARRKFNWDGAFIGLRAAENAQRRHMLRKQGLLFACQRHGVWECNPIAWWSTEDVWTYIHAHGVPYNRAYDKLAAMGVPLERQRIGPLAQARVLGYGQMALLKRGWPDLYNRFVARYPEASAYV